MGDTALWDEPPNAQITPEQAHEVAANWKDTTQLSNALDAMAYECGRLREQLDAEQVNGKRKFDQARRMFRRARLLQQQLDAADEAFKKILVASFIAQAWKIARAARAALGVEINDGKEEDDEQG